MSAIAHDDWPVHQPDAPEAPIPGRYWYAGCEPGGDWDYELGNYTGTSPRIDPFTGVCEGCGRTACRVCGRENCPDHPYQHLIGKRVNVAGEIGTVIAVEGETPIAVIEYDLYEVHGMTLASVVDRLPELVARASFQYRPGDAG